MDYTLFTFIREPVSCFLSGAAEVIQRAFKNATGHFKNVTRRINWGPWTTATPRYYSLADTCGRSDQLVRAFVSDVVARRNMGAEAFHVFPQVLPFVCYS